MTNHWVHDLERPLIIAHRGASADAPENTLAAFALALEQKADGIELDVYLSADGVPVVIHDRHLDRTTTGTGFVGEHTLEALQRFDAGQGESIPTLEAVLAEFGKNFLYNIEIKPQPGRPESEILKLINRYDVMDRTLISSFDPKIMRRVRQKKPFPAMLALLRIGGGPQRFTYLFFKGAAEHPHFGLVNRSYMEWAKKQGLRIHVWTVDHPQEADRLRNLGVHGLITNKPGEFHARWTS